MCGGVEGGGDGSEPGVGEGHCAFFDHFLSTSHCLAFLVSSVLTTTRNTLP